MRCARIHKALTPRKFRPASDIPQLGGTPYGGRYIRKTPETPEPHELYDTEAVTVPLMFEKHTIDEHRSHRLFFSQARTFNPAVRDPMRVFGGVVNVVQSRL